MTKACICRRDGIGRTWDESCPEHGDWIREEREHSEHLDAMDEIDERKRGL